MDERIFLIGFMGTGKTTVGQALADKLGWAFFDSDQVLVERAGRTIPEIFAAEGEAYFRQLEADVLRDLAVQRQVVITTGGGAVLRAENRELMKTCGFVVQLQATVEEIVKRVASDSNRPLLQGEDLRTRITTLMRERKGLYDFAPCRIDTTDHTVAEIVDQIILYLSAPSR